MWSSAAHRWGGRSGRNASSTKHNTRNLLSRRLGFEPLEDRRLLTIGIGDFVWNDLNANGLQDLNEPGLASAGVELYASADATVGNTDDVLVAQTVTDATGHYSFESLSSGVNYYLTFRLPGAYSFTLQHAGSDNALDSDANAAGTTALYTLSPDQNNLGLDAGVRGSAPAFGWAIRNGGTKDDIGRSVASDAHGNVYVAGTFSGMADFDPGPGVYNLTPVGGTNIFAAKYSSSGALLWARSFGGGGFDARCQIALDQAGNVFVTGAFSGTADFDPGVGNFPLSSAGGYDIFVSKLDSAGNSLWARNMGGPKDDFGLALALSNDGSVYTTGSFQDTADFDPGTDTFNLTSQADLGYADIFISKLDANGNFVWARQMGGYGDDYGNSIALGSDGAVYTTGSFQYEADFDPGDGTFYLNSVGGSDIFVSKLDAGGNFVWARQMGSAEFDSGNSIALGSDGSAYTTGYFRGTADFDPGDATYNLITAGSRDIFISKLSAAGNFVWAKRIGGTSTDTAYCLAVDNYGGVYSTGYFQGTADFDPGAGSVNLSSAGGEDIFVLKLDEAGNFIWAKRMGGTNYDVGYSIATRSNTSVIITGYFQGTVDFDPGTGISNLISSGGADVFVTGLVFQPPTDIQLSSDTVPEHAPAGTFVGLLSSTDLDLSAHTYILISGEGADDNDRFIIVGNQLKTNASLDYETKSTYSIRISSRNASGASYVKSFIISATDTAEMSVGDSVWLDANENGIQDAGEMGLGGVKVKLYYSSDGAIGNADDRLMGETITDAQGIYIFHQVSYAMNYYLVFLPPIQYFAFTLQDIGGDDTLDSDANAAGFTGLFTLSAGQQDDSRDAGFMGSPLENGWANGIGGPSTEKSQAVATDAQGNVYVTGYFQGTVDFDPGPGIYNLVGKGGYDIFVAKYSPEGPLLWAKSMGGTGNDAGASIAISDYGIVYLTGYFNGTADFDPGAGMFNLTSAGNSDIFVAMIDFDGSFFYAWRMGGTGMDQGLSIAAGSDGSLVTTGYFFGTANFDPWGGTLNMTSAGSTDIYIFKLDSNWNFAWVKQFGGTGADQGLSLAVGSDGSVLTTGYFNGIVDFNPGAGTSYLTSAGDWDIFVSRLDAAGNFVWAKRMGGPSRDQGLSLALGSDGSVFTAGYFSNVADFDPGSETYNLTSVGSADIYVSKLDSAGNFVWASQMGGLADDFGNSMAVGSDGTVYTTGYFSVTADFDLGAGTFNLTSAGGTDIFISKLDNTGNFIGAWRIGGIGSDNGISIVSGSQGSIITTGIFAGVVDFNLGPHHSFLTGVGSSDVYLAKYYLNSPTDIQLSSCYVQENLLVGTLSSIDPDPGEVFTYAFVPGVGDADNGLFLIDGDQLKANTVFDYGTKSSYSIRMRTTDYTGLWFEKVFTISVIYAPVTRTWDGGGTDNLWTKSANWVDDVAPLPSDNLVFPAGAAQPESFNDYPTGTHFGSITISGSGYNFQGNPYQSSRIEVQPNAQLDVGSVNTDTLTLGVGSRITISPIPGGPTADNALTPLALQPIPPEPVVQPTVPDAAVQSSTTTTADAAEPLAANTVLTVQGLASSEETTMAVLSSSLSNTVLDAIATPTAIVADIALPVRLPEHVQTSLIDTTFNRLPPQSPIFSQIDSTALPWIIEDWLKIPLAEKQINISKTSMLTSLQEESLTHSGIIEKRVYTQAIFERQAHFTDSETIVRNIHLCETDAEVDIDITRHARAGKHARQFERMIDTVLADNEDAILERPWHN